MKTIDKILEFMARNPDIKTPHEIGNALNLKRSTVRGRLSEHRQSSKSEEIQKNNNKISFLNKKLHYINNKEKVNKNRKKYQRQTWADRKDNPENKGLSKTEICFKNFFRSIIDAR